MTAEQLSALKAAAEKATRGPWHWDDHRVPSLHGRGGDPDVYEYDVEVIEAEHNGECGCRSACELHLWVNDHDAAFIAAADPSTVLALLDRLAKVQDVIVQAEEYGEEIDPDDLRGALVGDL